MIDVFVFMGNRIACLRIGGFRPFTALLDVYYTTLTKFVIFQTIFFICYYLLLIYTSSLEFLIYRHDPLF